MKDYKLLYAEENFDESFSLKVYYKDAMSFGPQLIRVLAERRGEEPKVILEEKIYNDGQNIRESNAAIKWMANSAELTFRGKEQEKKKYKILLNQGKYEISLLD